MGVGTELYVNAMNRRRLPYWLGLNVMADWTPAEKKQLRGRLHTPAGTTVRSLVSRVRPAPMAQRCSRPGPSVVLARGQGGGSTGGSRLACRGRSHSAERSGHRDEGAPH